ncbi:hypothetical protein MWU57_13685 [Isoptericola sp. S6320L]|uniref:hypothetical protein n=1 Tax=Isoptericola sp. S6320L TaxID=2926411 RepID=UPI001FF43BD0|nr:hypothetical protein [Isoptericola sp. S6320L]MCK0118086.1 hypothetical protein [Isoptericola sp. S6320L]
MSTDPQPRPDGPEHDERITDGEVPATQQLPSGEVPATQQLPSGEVPTTASPRSSARASEDPLAVFDEPARSADPAPATDVPAGSPPLVRSGPRTTTIVWGLVVVAIGVGLLARSAGATIDVELAAILLLGAAGLLLVVGSVAGGVRRRRRTTAA